jgi:hypothetical protein
MKPRYNGRYFLCQVFFLRQPILGVEVGNLRQTHFGGEGGEQGWGAGVGVGGRDCDHSGTFLQVGLLNFKIVFGVWASWAHCTILKIKGVQV